jgi:hypothetical protein
MPLKIRQGFFRTWIALSAAWIAGVVAVAAFEATRSAPTVDRFTYSLQLDKLAPSDATQVESFPEWFLTERDFPEDGIRLLLPRPEPKGLWESAVAEKQAAAAGIEKRGPGEAYRTIVAPSALPELLQRAKRLQMQVRVRKIGSVLAAALVPPALLLFLGIAISRFGEGAGRPMVSFSPQQAHRRS